MDRAQKRELVSTLNEAWKDSGVLVVAHYAGMTVAQMTEFRKRMKEAGGCQGHLRPENLRELKPGRGRQDRDRERWSVECSRLRRRVREL